MEKGTIAKFIDSLNASVPAKKREPIIPPPVP
jgi:hypothetical protein